MHLIISARARGQAASQQHFGRWLLSKQTSKRDVSIAGSTSIGRFLCLLDGLERLRTRSSVPRRVPVVARRSGERYSSLSSEWGATKRRHEAAVNAIFGDRHSYRALDRCVPRLVRGLRSRGRQPKFCQSCYSSCPGGHDLFLLPPQLHSKGRWCAMHKVKVLAETVESRGKVRAR